MFSAAEFNESPCAPLRNRQPGTRLLRGQVRGESEVVGAFQMFVDEAGNQWPMAEWARRSEGSSGAQRKGKDRVTHQPSEGAGGPSSAPCDGSMPGGGQWVQRSRLVRSEYIPRSQLQVTVIPAAARACAG